MEETVYVYLANVEVGETFLQMAEDEGFRFPDGELPSRRAYTELMLISGGNVNYVDSIGKLVFKSDVNIYNNAPFIRVDFKNYINGNEHYIMDSYRFYQ